MRVKRHYILLLRKVIFQLIVSISTNLSTDLIDFAIKILNFGPKLNIKDNKGETPIVVAVRRGHLDLVRRMAEKDARLDVLTNRGDSLLHFAARINRIDII